jgi:hypothetical protein
MTNLRPKNKPSKGDIRERHSTNFCEKASGNFERAKGHATGIELLFHFVPNDTLASFVTQFV